MSIIHLQLLAIIFITSLACALPGNFLILSGSALIVDAISHAILLGIVIMFLIVKNIHSSCLFFGAIIAGLVTVSLTEFFVNTKLVKKDAAIGITFPFLFSIAVLLINQFANKIHLDIDAVLLGELAFAPFDRLFIYGIDIGPISLWHMSAILILQIIFIFLFYKELKITIFDKELATVIGYNPTAFHYALMTLTSISVIGAFHTAGTILVVALIIIPPASAYLITCKLHEMIILSCIISLIAATCGYAFAHMYNSSIAGSIAATNGCIFACFLAWKLLAKNKNILCN